MDSKSDSGVGLGKPGFTQLQLFWVPAHQDFGDWVQGALDLGNSGVTQVFGVYLRQIWALSGLELEADLTRF